MDKMDGEDDGDVGMASLGARILGEMRAAFQEGHDRGYDKRQRCLMPGGAVDWASSRAIVKAAELAAAARGLEKGR